MCGRSIDAVIFDVGHVLYDWDPAYLYEKLIPDRERLQWFVTNVVTKDWHYQHDQGRPFAETSAELVARFPEERDLINAYGPRWLETIGEPVPGMHELARMLSMFGLSLFGITNFSAEFWAQFRPTAPIFDLFDDVVVSGEERLTKPGREIFEIAKRRFSIDPGRALFIDDQPANVEAARDSGFLAHHFQGRAGVDARLAELGVSLA